MEVQEEIELKKALLEGVSPSYVPWSDLHQSVDTSSMEMTGNRTSTPCMSAMKCGVDNLRDNILPSL